jgi:hypothetical protein
MILHPREAVAVHHLNGHGHHHHRSAVLHDLQVVEVQVEQGRGAEINLKAI